MSEERKLCPNCGHSNRAVAKNCTQCGFALFHSALSGVVNTTAAESGLLRKRCSQCGAMNRMGAKVCSQCGKAFRGKLISFRQKWCPQCGAERRPNAKVCSFCGYRFQEESAPIKPLVMEPPVVLSNDLSAPITVRTELPHTPAPISAEAPKVQKGITTPDLTSTTMPTAAPLMPEAPLVQSNALAEPVKVHSVTGTTPTPKPRDLSGEPAPYISKDELDRLRRMGDQNSGLFLRRRDNKR